MSNEFIDVFYNAASTAYPYITMVFAENGTLVASKVHYQIASVAAWCKIQALPVRVHDRQVRAQLRDFGVDARPPTRKLMG